MRTNKYFYITASLVALSLIFSCTERKPIDANTLLEHSIKYHDPNGQWQSISIEFDVLTELSDAMSQQIGMEQMHSSMNISNATGDFFLETDARGDKIALKYHAGGCEISVNDSEEVPGEIINKHMAMVNLTNCETARMAINYQLFLAGLPMKLQDPGTNITQEVMEVEYMGNQFYGIKVVYDQDTWHFYFDKSNYALRGYEFSFNNADFAEKILLEDEAEVRDLKIAMVRKWYDTNENFLLSETLSDIK